MVRRKHENISMKFIALLTLCLCYSLTIYLSLAPAYAVPPPKQHYFVVDAYQTPGAVYRIQNRRPGIFFRRRSGNISSIALCNGQLYFCSTNDRRIHQKIEQRERVVFEHTTYIRDIAVDPNGNLYFSEASGAGGDGRIYKLNPRANALPSEQCFSISNEEGPIQVRLSTVDGFWDGDFTFDAESNLYLSSGNRTPAFIYRVPKEGSQYGSPRKLYKDIKGSIKGIAIDLSSSDFIYYADWKQTIHKLNLRYLGRSVEFSGNVAGSRNPRLSDVAFNVRIEN